MIAEFIWGIVGSLIFLGVLYAIGDFRHRRDQRNEALIRRVIQEELWFHDNPDKRP